MPRTQIKDQQSIGETSDTKELIGKTMDLQEHFHNLRTYQCSLYQSDTRGMSCARRILPERMLKGRGANSKAIPAIH